MAKKEVSRDVKLEVRLTSVERDRLREAAAARGCSVSDFVRGQLGPAVVGEAVRSSVARTGSVGPVASVEVPEAVAAPEGASGEVSLAEAARRVGLPYAEAALAVRRKVLRVEGDKVFFNGREF